MDEGLGLLSNEREHEASSLEQSERELVLKLELELTL